MISKTWHTFPIAVVAVAVVRSVVQEKYVFMWNEFKGETLVTCELKSDEPEFLSGKKTLFIQILISYRSIVL